MKKVVIYSTPTCVYCNKAKKYFDEHNVEYTNIDVSKDVAAAEEMVKKSDQMGVPVIVVSEDNVEHVIIGFDQPKLAEILEITN